VLTPRIRAALVVLAASAGLGACTNMGPYGGVGVGVGSSYGYGSPYGYGGYGSPYYSSSYYGGYPYFGWYDGFYYPGAGYWVYDPYGRQYPITQRQSHYWRNMLDKFRAARGEQATTTAVTQNFSGFRAKAKTGASIRGVDLNAQAQAQGQADQRSLRQISEVRRQAVAERQQELRTQREQVQQVRSERQEAFRQQVLERREQRRARTKSDD